MIYKAERKSRHGNRAGVQESDRRETDGRCIQILLLVFRDNVLLELLLFTEIPKTIRARKGNGITDQY